MPFYIGKFSKPIDQSSVIHLEDPVETETLEVGDIVQRWDHIFEWDENCLKASDLEAWRATGDDLCDAAIKSMFTNTSCSQGIDLLERLYADVALNPGGASQALLEDASRLPPEDIAACPREIQEAQAFFLEHSIIFMQSLMHFSLAGGFASPRITRVLQSVSYLVPSYGNHTLSSRPAAITTEMNDRTYSRLLETFQFILDVMACTKPSATPAPEGNLPETNLAPGGEGWKAAIRVRLLHGVARRRILDRLYSSHNTYSVDDDGVPINQEDMSATLGSFSAAPLWCFTRLYSVPIPPPTPSQATSFIATWRHVGFYLGVDPVILRKHFASPDTANKFLMSTVIHLLTSTPPGSPQPLFPTLPILLSTSNRPPFPRSFEHHCALTRRLLGPSLSSHLGIPPTPAWAELRLLFSLFTTQLPVLFSRVYPRRAWSAKRAELTREALARVLRFQMGMRRTTYRARTEQGEVGADVLKLEAVKPDPQGGKKLVKEYRVLMLEMVGVMTGLAVLFLGSLLGYWACNAGRMELCVFPQELHGTT